MTDHPGKQAVEFFQAEVNIASARAFLNRFLEKHGEAPVESLDQTVPSFI